MVYSASGLSSFYVWDLNSSCREVRGKERGDGSFCWGLGGEGFLCFGKRLVRVPRLAMTMEKTCIMYVYKNVFVWKRNGLEDSSCREGKLRPCGQV